MDEELPADLQAELDGCVGKFVEGFAPYRWPLAYRFHGIGLWLAAAF